MMDLIKYEFLKLAKRKSSLVVVLAGIVVTAFLSMLPTLQSKYYTQDGAVEGMAGIAIEKADVEATAGLLTSDLIAQNVEEYQRLFDDPANIGTDGSEEYIIGGAYWDFVAPRERMLQLIAANYDDPGDFRGLSTLRSLDRAACEDFYRARDEKIALTLENPSRKLTEDAKAYWSSMGDSVAEPFDYGWFKGWDVILSSFELLVFAILAVCIALAPAFAGEYTAGTDAVILSSRYGKSKLAHAKIIAAYLFGLAAFTLIAAIALAIPLVSFGLDGWDKPVQISNTVIPYNLTFLQATLLNLGVIYLVLGGMIALTLLLSSKLKSPYLVLVVLVPLLFLPLFLTPSGTAGVYNQTLFLLPYRATMPELSKFITYQMGPLVMDAFTMRAVIYLAIIAICVPLSARFFKRHQVS